MPGESKSGDNLIPIDVWNAALKSGKARGITRQNELEDIAHACCYEASQKQWKETDLEDFIESFIKKKKKEWDKLANWYAWNDVWKYLETTDVNDSVAYKIASAWCNEVAKGFPGKMTNMKLFVAYQYWEWDDAFKLLEDRACEKARMLFL